VTGIFRAVNIRHNRQNPARAPYSNMDSTFMLRWPGRGLTPSTCGGQMVTASNRRYLVAREARLRVEFRPRTWTNCLHALIGKLDLGAGRSSIPG
jgi:hypothetical protein